MSLNKIAQIFNINNKLPFPYKFINKDNLNYIGEIPSKFYFNSEKDYLEFIKINKILDIKKYTIYYCNNDIDITINFLINIKNILKNFKIKIENSFSAPSIALKIFQKNFNNDIIKTSYNNLIEKFARNSYFGGRCEVYGNALSNENIFHFDFSGMYAQCMSEKFPFGKHSYNIYVKDFDKPGIYRIEYNSINTIIPILPHHRLIDNKLMFTNGKMIGAFWYEEILLFIKYGGIIEKILYSLTFEKYDYVFKEYVDFFTKLRLKSKEYNVFSKLMINSLYGRLGMNKIENHSFIYKKENMSDIIKKIDIISYKELNNIVIINAKINKKLKNVINIKEQNIKNNIVIASAITSKGRIKLYEAQQSVIKNNGRLLYLI